MHNGESEVKDTQPVLKQMKVEVAILMYTGDEAGAVKRVEEMLSRHEGDIEYRITSIR